MNEREEREQRWTAYYLNELPPEEREEVEAELRASPEAAEDYRIFVEAVSAWTKEPVAHAPLSVEEVRTAAEPQRSTAPHKRHVLFRRVVWVGAAVLALVVGVGVVQQGVSVTVGDTTVRLGPSPPSRNTDALMSEVATLRGDLSRFQAELTSCRGELQQVSRENAALGSQFRLTAAQLTRNQQLETQTRYRDVRHVLRLAGLESPETEEWSVRTLGGIGERKDE